MQKTKAWLLETLRVILAEEREAIQCFDVRAMDRTSNAKERVLAELHAIPFDERGPFIEALAELQPELRKNMMLLTHAAAFIAETRRKIRTNAIPERLAS